MQARHVARRIANDLLRYSLRIFLRLCREMPGFRPATICQLQLAADWVASSRGVKPMGTHDSERAMSPGTSGNSKSRRITPITTYGLRSSRILVPSICGSPWKRSCHVV